MTLFTIEPPTHDALGFILERARKRDWREIRAVAGDVSVDALSRALMDNWVRVGAWGGVFATEVPVAFLFATRETHRSLQVSLIATDDFPAIAWGVTRYVREDLAPQLAAQGYQRAECRCWEGHHDARRWLKLCGATEEAEIVGYGNHGETFVQMAWRPEDVYRRKPETAHAA